MELDLMFVLLFASFHTTSLALTLAVKLLADHPRVLDEPTVEHETILNLVRHVGSSSDGDTVITWKEYKSMTFTSQVINETGRLANIAPAIFRKTLKDVQFKGDTLLGIACPPVSNLPKRPMDHGCPV